MPLTKISVDLDPRGKLIFMEALREVPFPIKRMFVIYDAIEGAVRGEHAHRKCHQFLIVLHGAVSVELDDGKRKSREFMSDPTQGLYVPAMTWLTLRDFRKDTVCAVLASDPYESEDYIRDYALFRTEAGAAAR